MVSYKRKWSFRCIYKWACPHITFAHGIAEINKSEHCILFARIFFVPVLGIKVEGKSLFSDKFTVIGV